MIERTIAGGVISHDEVQAIRTQAWSDGKVTLMELKLYQDLILSKNRSGELAWSFDS